jgi:hypothetical protein
VSRDKGMVYYFAGPHALQLGADKSIALSGLNMLKFNDRIEIVIKFYRQSVADV